MYTRFFTSFLNIEISNFKNFYCFHPKNIIKEKKRLDMVMVTRTRNWFKIRGIVGGGSNDR